MRSAALSLWALGASCGPSAETPALATADSSIATPAAVLGDGSRAVLRIGSELLGEEEVRARARALELLFPAATAPELARLALTNELLQQRAIAQRYRHDRSVALAESMKVLAELRSGVAEPALPPSAQCRGVEGDWRALGFPVWYLVRGQALRAWSEPLDATGQLVLVRLDVRDGNADPALELFSAALIYFPYLPDPRLEPDAADRAIDSTKLEILDPAYAEIVPEMWKHRMDGVEGSRRPRGAERE